METDQSFCVSCSASSEQDHYEMRVETMADYAIMLRAKEFGYADTFDRIIRDWRTHALPECDPLALT
jgi:hypothetical protein